MTIQTQFGNDGSETSSQWTPYRSREVITYDVIAGHGNVYGNNSSQNRVKAVDEASMCLSCYDTSTDMQHDLPGSLRDLDLLSYVGLTFQDHHAKVSARLDEWKTMASEACCQLSCFRSYQLKHLWPKLAIHTYRCLWRMNFDAAVKRSESRF